MPNNTLGSYGMYVHAFLRSRSRGRSRSLHGRDGHGHGHEDEPRPQYTHYLFSEDDYLPLVPHFDAALVRMHRATFGAAQLGCLAGVLQGRPLEPTSRYLLHLESSHIMSAAALEAVLDALRRADAPRRGGVGAAMVRPAALDSHSPLQPLTPPYNPLRRSPARELQRPTVSSYLRPRALTFLR